MSDYVGGLRLKEPLTKKDWDIIADTDFKHTSKVTFTTPHCGEVEFVKVVRCEECKHRVTNEYSLYYGYCTKTKLFPKPDWFCKDGERREE